MLRLHKHFLKKVNVNRTFHNTIVYKSSKDQPPKNDLESNNTSKVDTKGKVDLFDLNVGKGFDDANLKPKYPGQPAVKKEDIVEALGDKTGRKPINSIGNYKTVEEMPDVDDETLDKLEADIEKMVDQETLKAREAMQARGSFKTFLFGACFVSLVVFVSLMLFRQYLTAELAKSLLIDTKDELGAEIDRLRNQRRQALEQFLQNSQCDEKCKLLAKQLLSPEQNKKQTK